MTNARRPARRTAPHLISSHLDDTDCHAPTVESTTRALPLRTFWEWRPLSSRGLAVPRVPSLCGHSRSQTVLEKKKERRDQHHGHRRDPSLTSSLSHSPTHECGSPQCGAQDSDTRETAHTHCCVVSVSNKCVQSAHAPFLLRSSRCSTQPHAVSHSLTHSPHSLPSLSLVTLFPSLSLWTGGTETGTVHDS